MPKTSKARSYLWFFPFEKHSLKRNLNDVLHFKFKYSIFMSEFYWILNVLNCGSTVLNTVELFFRHFFTTFLYKTCQHASLTNILQHFFQWSFSNTAFQATLFKFFSIFSSTSLYLFFLNFTSVKDFLQHFQHFSKSFFCLRGLEMSPNSIRSICTCQSNRFMNMTPVTPQSKETNTILKRTHTKKPKTLSFRLTMTRRQAKNAVWLLSMHFSSSIRLV